MPADGVIRVFNDSRGGGDNGVTVAKEQWLTWKLTTAWDEDSMVNTG
jgi:hypothetical protein